MMRLDPFTKDETLIKRGSPLPEDFAAIGMKVTDYFVGHGYTKVFDMPAGTVIGQHKHKIQHSSTLILGKVKLVRDGQTILLTAPSTIMLGSGVSHEVHALEHSLWACIWPDAEGATTEAEVEAKVIV